MSEEAMRFCSECGSQLGEGDEFCAECGTRIASEATAMQDVPVQSGATPGAWREAVGAGSEAIADRHSPSWIFWAIVWAITWGVGAFAACAVFFDQVGGAIVLFTRISSQETAVLAYASSFAAGGLFAGALAGWSLHFANGRYRARTWPAALVSGICWSLILGLLGAVSGEKLQELPAGSGTTYELLLHFYFVYAGVPAGLVLSLVAGAMAKPAVTPPPYRGLKLVLFWIVAAIVGSVVAATLVVVLLGRFELIGLAT